MMNMRRNLLDLVPVLSLLALSTAGALPVLSDSEFDSRRSEAIRRLGGGPEIVTV